MFRSPTATPTPVRPKPPPKKYAAKKARETDRQRGITASGREIGPPAAVGNPARKDRCRDSLLAYCEAYFPRRFYLSWSPAHRAAVARLERCAIAGGLFAYAMPRGDGKTTLAEVAVMWSVSYGHRRFAVPIGATDGHAGAILDSIKAEWETNDLLHEDFPEITHPVRCLEGIGQRAGGQTIGGRRTRIQWSGGEIVLPTVAGSPASGAVVRAVGITGAIRGMRFTGSDGRPIRPDFVILDDPQTDESARSLSQTRAREDVITKAVLGLAGPGRKIAAAMPCTVIEPNDLADRLLDREKSPEWQGERSRMLLTFPSRMDLWDRYAELRAEGLRAGDEGAGATAFYVANRADMDAGAAVSWPDRHNPDEVSGLQHAMNLFYRSPRAFAAECQNDPQQSDDLAASKELSAPALLARTTDVKRGEVPRDATRLTAFVDVGGALHWYSVVAWDERFNGWLVDFGAWPKQSRSYFEASDPRPSLAVEYPGMSEEQRVYAGLQSLTAAVIARTYPRHQTGEPVRVDRCLIDSGWQTDTVHLFVRQSPLAAILTASKGYAARVSNARPIDEWAVRPGERRGPGWRLGTPAAGKGALCTFDPDVWKSFVAERLLTPPGGAGCLLLPAGRHDLLCDHLTAEYAQRVTARGRTFDHWSVRPDRRDNHLWDCLVGAAVAASVAGLRWQADGETPPPPKPREKFSEVVRRKAAEAAAKR